MPNEEPISLSQNACPGHDPGSPEGIHLAEMVNVRFPPSRHKLEDFLHERGINLRHETARFWWKRFGPMFAAEIRKRRAAQDGAANASTAATPLSINFDGSAPTVAITSRDSGTVGGPFAISINFSENVFGFVEGDLVVSNATVSNFNAASGDLAATSIASGSAYAAIITPTADGPVTIDVAAGVANDAAGNANTAAT